MSSQTPREDTGESPGRFERNNYFHGKLMTARDMEAEQLYHRGRLETTARHVLGTGLVTGLGTKLKEENGRLEATIESGVALDSRGRPVVVVADGPIAVRNDRTGETEPPGGRNVYVYLEYRECETEQVPGPSSTNGAGGECSYSRVVEKFDIYYTRNAPTFKTVSHLAFPTREEVGEDDGTAEPDDPGLGKMARSYYERAAESEEDEPVSLLLGQFRKEADDGGDVWTRVESGEDRRPLVYTNDMLYAIIARHVTNFEDPHGSGGLRAIAGVGSTDGNVELSSTDETIAITRYDDQGKGRVNLEVASEVVSQEELEGEIGEVNSHIDTVEKDHSNDVNDLQDRIKQLEEAVAKLQKRLDNVEEDVEENVDEDDERGPE